MFINSDSFQILTANLVLSTDQASIPWADRPTRSDYKDDNVSG